MSTGSKAEVKVAYAVEGWLWDAVKKTSIAIGGATKMSETSRLSTSSPPLLLISQWNFLYRVPTKRNTQGFYFGRIWAAAAAKSVKWKLVLSIIMNKMPIQIVWYYIRSRRGEHFTAIPNLVRWQRWTKIKPFDWIYFRPSSITTFIRSSSLNSNQLLAISATQGSSSTTSKESYEEDKKKIRIKDVKHVLTDQAANTAHCSVSQKRWKLVTASLFLISYLTNDQRLSETESTFLMTKKRATPIKTFHVPKVKVKNRHQRSSIQTWTTCINGTNQGSRNYLSLSSIHNVARTANFNCVLC